MGFTTFIVVCRSLSGTDFTSADCAAPFTIAWRAHIGAMKRKGDAEDRPTMCLDDRSGDRKPEPQPGGLRREERLEEMRQVLACDAMSLIDHLQQNLPLTERSANAYLPSGGSARDEGVQRIDHQIEHY